jgi:hypothetical protein
MSKTRRRLMIVMSVILIAVMLPITALAGSDTNGGITFNFPDNMIACNPTFKFSTTGIDPSWPWQLDVFKSNAGVLARIGGATGSGDVNFSLTPDALAAGDSTVFAAFLAVWVPGQEKPMKFSGQWRVDCGKEPPSGEGCTPGFWKTHPDVWPIPTDTDFDTTFGRNAFNPDITMLDATALKGGQLNALSRHAAAAYLNSISPVVNFDMSAAEVIAAFQAAFDSGDFNTTKDMFAALNELGCPY